MKSLLIFAAFFLVLEAIVVQVPLEKRSVSAEQRKMRQHARHPKSRAVRPHAPGQFVEFDYYTQTLTVVVDQTDHQFFVVDASKSSTSTGINENYRTEYFGGEAEGYTVRDAFSLQGLQVAGQTFGSVTDIIDVSPGGFPVDGVLGLTGSIFGYDSPLQNLAGQLDAPQYTIWIGPHVPPSQGTIQGTLTLGDFDSDHCGPLAVQVDQYALDQDFVFEISRVDIGAYSRSGDFYGWQDVSFSFLG
ncbi:Cathepsin E-A [Aphelenchoides fujianensis]|nr:Cathepsin E-A [Aphelenchoides fujianensis]